MVEKIKDVIERLAEDIGCETKEYKISESNDIGIIFDVSHEYSMVFQEPHIDMIYGIGLTEENYIRTIHNVAELNTENGLILLCCEELEILDKAFREEMLRGENNVLLYCLSEERRIYVKSVKKGEKAFLKRIFGKEKLLFPEK